MNNICLAGLVEDFQFSYSRGIERFNSFNMVVERKSGVYDIIKCVVSDNIEFVPDENNRIYIEGEIRNRNYSDDTGRHSEIYVFVSFIGKYAGEDINFLEFDGFICQQPVMRRTPSTNRKVTDVLLANNRRNFKSTYVYCLAWGRDAELCGDLIVGCELMIEGHLQSRTYIKCIGENTIERRICEISISSMCVHFNYETEVEFNEDCFS